MALLLKEHILRQCKNMRCNSQANKPINYLMNVKCCFSERLETAAQLHFLPQKYKNLEKTKQNYLLNIQIMG